jgi:predicted DNA-binding protein
MGDEIVHLRIPDKIYKRLKQMAQEQGRPLSNLLRHLLTQVVEKEK